MFVLQSRVDRTNVTLLARVQEWSSPALSAGLDRCLDGQRGFPVLYDDVVINELFGGCSGGQTRPAHDGQMLWRRCPPD